MNTKNHHTVLLSLDTSSTATGYAIFVNGKYKESGEIKSKGVKEKRRNDMILRLERAIKEISPDIIVIEIPSKPLNAYTQRILTIIYGACLTFALQLNIEFVERRPSASRKDAIIFEPDEAIPKDRKEIKSWAIAFTEKKTGKTDILDNEADAYIQGLGYLNWWKKQESMGKIKKKGKKK